MWHPWLRHLEKCIIVDVLTAIEVQFLEVERVRVLAYDFHGFTVDMLAVAEA